MEVNPATVNHKELYRILVDMDCTICDFEAHFLELYKVKYPHLPYVSLADRRTFYLIEQYRSFGEQMAVCIFWH